MATIQIKRRTSAGTGPLTGAGTVKAGEPLIDLKGGNLYVAKADKTNNLTASDYLEFISKNNLVAYINGKIGDLDLGTAAKFNVGETSGKIPVIDSDGKLKSSIIPQIAITDTFVCNSQSAMTSLSSAQIGDICVRTDLNKTFILKTSPASTASNWQELLTPTDKVTSVNGKTGAVNLSSADVGAVSTSTFNSHKADNTHLTAAQRNILKNVFISDVTGNISSVGTRDTESEVVNESITDGLLMHYEVTSQYDMHLKKFFLGINKSKVLTPTSVIDGGTF